MPTSANKLNQSAIAMNHAMRWLDERGVYYKQLPPYQLKIGQINYWPGRGTITIDGEISKRAEKGLEALEALLTEAGAFSTEGFIS